jgi:hypothetical protein
MTNKTNTFNNIVILNLFLPKVSDEGISIHQINFIVMMLLLCNLPLGQDKRNLINSSEAQVFFTAFWIGYVLLCRKTFTELKKTNHNISRRTL